MIRPYLRDFINNHKPTAESNNEEIMKKMKKIMKKMIEQDQKIQLVMQNNVFLLKILKILAPYIQQVNLQKFIWVVTQKCH